MKKIEDISIGVILFLFIFIIIYLFIPRTQTPFESIDLNSDGYISKKEFAIYMQQKNLQAVGRPQLLKCAVSGAIRGAVLGLILGGPEAVLVSSLVFSVLNPAISIIESTL
jgi:hypothetical protein